MGDLAAVKTNPLVEMRGITKRFGNVTVLDHVNFDLRAGEVHVLAGENGAGKSTLIKILAGAHTDFDGEIRIHGQSVRPKSPYDASELGVSVIYQELSLIGPMSVADNIFLGQSRTHAGFVDDMPAFRSCKRVVATTGAVTAFSWRGKALSSDEIAVCNTRARS